MVAFSYKRLRTLMRTIPICPKPKAVGLKNIPDNEPIIYVYNHLTRRGEPVYLGMAAPSKPNIRFLAETIIVSPEYKLKLFKEVEDAIFPPRFQNRARKSLWIKLWYSKLINFLTKYVIAQATKLKVINVHLFQAATDEEKLKKLKMNKQAFIECIRTLERNVPIAIAPSGGRTHTTVENPVYHTIVPTLASSLYKRGKTVKIVPSIIKEAPMITKRTYWKYVADRFFFYKAFKRFMGLFNHNNYRKPRLIVEFLPPLTFRKKNPSKPEKIEFVKKIQQLIYKCLGEPTQRVSP
jgi:1-acyl-sn-glycerol-3-phosphate acyltransferase